MHRCGGMRLLYFIKVGDFAESQAKILTADLSRKYLVSDNPDITQNKNAKILDVEVITSHIKHKFLYMRDT